MKKIGVLLAPGFEEVEALTVVDVLRRAGEHCDLVSVNGSESVTGSHNIEIKADVAFSDDIKEYEMIVLPGGLPGSTNLQSNKKVIDMVKYFNNNNKYIAAICAAPIVLKEAGIISNKKVTSYPGYEDELGAKEYIEDQNVVIDGNIITSRGPATTLAFSYKILEVLGNNKFETLKEGMMYNFLLR